MPKTKYPIFKCLHRGQKGFTLIELLIVIAILGIIAAVVVPNVGKFIGKGEEEAKAAELQIVQSAMDMMMVDRGITAVTEVTAATNAMGSFPCTTAASGCTSLYPDYLRDSTTAYTYTCSATGEVSQA